MEAKAESQAPVDLTTVVPRRLIELHEYNGDLNGFEQTARGFLTVHIGDEYFMLPISLKPKLEKLRDKWIAVTLIRKKYYLREMPPSAPSEGDLLRARVAEMEAENARLRAGGGAG